MAASFIANVDVEHSLGMFFRFCAGMGGMTFLPVPSVRRNGGAHSADDIGPLVDQDGQVAIIWTHGVHRADDGLGSWRTTRVLPVPGRRRTTATRVKARRALSS